MPRLIETPVALPAIDLPDLIDWCDRPGFDPCDPDGLVEAAPMLRALANNRDFLCDLAIAELKQRCATQLHDNDYSPQVLMLRPPGGGYLIRAAFWPSERDHVVRASGKRPFFYHVPHDHAFDFLTVGYLGPGYWSDYYEYDGASVAGVPGEPAGLRFVERSRLEEGKVLLYRAHRDVHDQLPPDSLSLSLNIMAIAPDQGRRRQYRFDLASGTIAACMTTSSAEVLLDLAVRLGDGNGIDLADQFSRRHADPALRMAAWRALGTALPDEDKRRAHYEAGTFSDSPLIRHASEAALQIAP